MNVGGLAKDKKTLKPSVIADPNPPFRGLTQRRRFEYLPCSFFTIAEVLSGLESSTTSTEMSKPRVSISAIKPSTFCDSQYVGRITPICERTVKSPVS